MRCLDWLYAWGWRKRALLLAALAQWLTALGVLLFVTPEFQGYAIGLTAYLLLSVLLILLLWDRRSIRVMVRGVSIALLSSSFLLTVISAVGGAGTNGLKPPVESLAYLACTFFQMTLLSVYPALAVAACRDGRLERVALRFAAAAECILAWGTVLASKRFAYFDVALHQPIAAVFFLLAAGASAVFAFLLRPENYGLSR